MHDVLRLADIISPGIVGGMQTLLAARDIKIDLSRTTVVPEQWQGLLPVVFLVCWHNLNPQTPLNWIFD